MADEPRPFQSPEEALLWLQSMLDDDESLWRLELNADYNATRRFFQARAYRDSAGWYGGEHETLIGAIAWLRHAVEDMEPG